jgi:tRNA (guanine6-N2)-methyltransferase
MSRESSSKRRKRNSPQRNRQSQLAGYRLEVEVAEGLERVAKDEIQQQLDEHSVTELNTRKGALQFYYAGDLQKLLNLKTVIAVYVSLYYDVPRPRALLGHEHFQKLLKIIDVAFSLVGKMAYQTLYLNAAGSDSSVMRRLKQEIATHTGLQIGGDEGDLLIRIRRARPGWEVLVRLSPRPLSTRDWRVCDMEGALNASVAQAMLRLYPFTPKDIFLNLMCGSGSLMIERLSLAPAQRIIGCDINPVALDCARANIAASGYRARTDIVLADVQSLPFADESIDVLCADLPFGQLVGSHAENRRLYPRILVEAARVTRQRASFLAITHEVRLMESILAKSTLWGVKKVHKITLSGLHPRIFVLRKR